MPPEARCRSEDQARSGIGKRRILIVEDNQVNMLILSAMLRKAGWEPLSAADGVEGVRMTRLYLPRLILMDLQMPRLDGFAATRAIHAAGEAEGYSPSIVAVTAAPESVSRERRAELGFVDLIAKPIEMAELLALVRRYMEPPG